MHLDQGLISIISIIISSVCTILVAIIENNAKQRRVEDDARHEEDLKRHERQEERERIRAKEMRLSMEMQYASIELGILNAEALKGGKMNGNVEEAEEKAKDARDSYLEFLRDYTSQGI